MSKLYAPLPDSGSAVTAPLVFKISLFFVAFYLIWKWSLKRRYNLPPGPLNFPVLGCIPLLDHKSPVKTFSLWAKKYGKFYYCIIGKDRVLVVNDPVLLKTLLSNDNCINRPGNPGAMFRKAESGGHCGM